MDKGCSGDQVVFATVGYTEVPVRTGTGTARLEGQFKFAPGRMIVQSLP